MTVKNSVIMLRKARNMLKLPYISDISGTKCYLCYHIEKHEMGRACSTYGGRREVDTGLWWERNHLED